MTEKTHDRWERALNISAALLLSAILVGIVYWMLVVWSDYRSPAPEEHPASLPACATEDSDNCYWDATVHGNGEGRSFVTLDGVTYYSTPTYELNGEEVPYVEGDDYVILVCPEGLSIGVDTTPDGVEWAGCM